MVPGYATFLSADQQERRDAFLGGARRLGTVEQNVEKDFWVCWTLAALFDGRPASQPRLLFKGGTSLSKTFGLISRFSEDIDVTVFRNDLGQNIAVEDLEKLSGRQRRNRLNAIKASCQAYVNSDMRSDLTTKLQALLTGSGLSSDAGRIEPDPDDADGQTLLVWYPTVTPTVGYVRPAIKIESGAKSALDPHSALPVRPYVADDLAGIDLAIPALTTVGAERTFWDKVVILHGLRRWFERRGALRGGGHRISRHYYDVYQLLRSDHGKLMVADVGLGADCVRHANMFFNSPDLDLETAKPGSFALLPTAQMRTELERDYRAMAGMIFGDIPSFNAICDEVAHLEAALNS
ncbi:MAG: nucleotidyl transferase AbiEii/AbiGii toxin family protein [Rhizomicrobium sp.]